jgi:hypothetical protein
MPILLPNGEGEDLNGSTCADTEKKTGSATQPFESGGVESRGMHTRIIVANIGQP